MKVVVTGSLSFDQVMSMPGRFKDYIMADKLHMINVSFLMETFSRHFGGTAGNQAYTLGLLGIKPMVVGTAGKDFGKYKSRLRSVGVDTSGIKIDQKKFTASGWCMTDRDDNQIWGFYSGAMAGDKNLSLKGKLGQGDLAAITPTEPLAMAKFIRECRENHYRFLFDPAFQIARFSQSSLKEGVAGTEILIGNDYEIALLQKRVSLKNNKLIITTLGRKGSILQMGKVSWRIPAAKAKNSKDPTGAGDAYRAGFLAGYIKKLPLPVCGRMGSLAAVYTVEKEGTQTHKFSLTEFKKRYKTNFKEELKYEI